MNNAQNTQDMITNNNLVSFSSYAATTKEALQMMGMELNFMTAFHFEECVKDFGMTLDNCHVLNGTFVKSTAMWSDLTKSYIIRTKSEKR